MGFTDEDLFELFVYDECSKSINETCINTDCTYNHVEMHDDELYKKVLKENSKWKKNGNSKCS